MLKARSDLVQSAIRGDPGSALLWISKTVDHRPHSDRTLVAAAFDRRDPSQRHLAAALAERGFTASQWG